MTLHALPGRPYLHYQDAQLMLEGVCLTSLAQTYGTPLFVYSQQSMLDALADYQQGFAGRNALICYAMKANSSLAILQTFAQAGCGFDIVSAGELERALRAGAPAQHIIFSGVGKTAQEMRRALEVGIGCFNVESEAELELLNQVATHMGLTAPVSLRVNPDVDAKTHPYISTGLKGNKFGIAHEHALAAYTKAASLPGLRVVGIDCHIGSQITETGPFLDAMDRVLDLVDQIERQGIVLEHIDFGGGLGIEYHGDEPPSAASVWQLLLTQMDARGYGHRKIIIEPGRSLVGNAGVCITQALYLKPTSTKNFLIVDAAMNDLPRPAMYQAYHAVVPLLQRSEPDSLMDIVGPVCESGDWLARERQLSVQPGDFLAVCSAGAYCMSMSSNYNSRGRAAEVMVKGQSHQLIRARESIQDQLQLEHTLTLAP